MLKKRSQNLCEGLLLVLDKLALSWHQKFEIQLLLNANKRTPTGTQSRMTGSLFNFEAVNEFNSTKFWGDVGFVSAANLELSEKLDFDTNIADAHCSNPVPNYIDH